MNDNLVLSARRVTLLLGRLLGFQLPSPTTTKAEASFLMTCVYFVAKSKQNLEAILRLCEAGYSIQAMMIARSTLEMSATLGYIAKDIPGRTLLFSDYDHVERHRWLKKAEKHRMAWGAGVLGNTDSGQHDEVRRAFAEVKDQYRDPYKWAGKEMSFGAICAAAGLSTSYDLDYGFLCCFTHNSTLLASQYFRTEESGTITVQSGPNPEYEDPAIATASIHALHVAWHLIQLGTRNEEAEYNELLSSFTPPPSGELKTGAGG